MGTYEDFVGRTDGTCGKDKDIIVTFKYDKKNEAIERILEKAKIEKSISHIIFELTFGDTSFRLYGSGKAIFRDMSSKEKLQAILTELLS
jgi:hypothetical protein